MNIQKMMKQAQQMQQKIADAQAEIEAKEIDGEAGNGLVKLTLTGKGALTKITLSSDLVADDDDREMLEDLLLAAHKNAKDQADAMAADAMNNAAGGMGLPPGMKLPF